MQRLTGYIIVKTPDSKHINEIQNFLSVAFLGANKSNKTGNKTRLVNVAINKVAEVNQPRALVPPKPLAQKIIKPAIKTNAVYTMLNPVLLMVALTVSSTLLL